MVPDIAVPIGPPALFPIGVHGLVNYPSGRGVLGEAVDLFGEAYGVHGMSKSMKPESAGIRAEGNGTSGPGNPAAAALEVANGAILVSGDNRPADSFPVNGPWIEMKSCGGSPSTQQTIGDYVDKMLNNELIIFESLIFVTVDTKQQSIGDTAYFAQVTEVHPGQAKIRVAAMANRTSSASCSLPIGGVKVNYLIINPAP